MPTTPPMTSSPPMTMRVIRVPERPPSSSSAAASGAALVAVSVGGASVVSVGSASTSDMVRLRSNRSLPSIWKDSSRSSKPSFVAFKVISPGAMGS